MAQAFNHMGSRLQQYSRWMCCITGGLWQGITLGRAKRQPQQACAGQGREALCMGQGRACYVLCVEASCGWAVGWLAATSPQAVEVKGLQGPLEDVVVGNTDLPQLHTTPPRACHHSFL